MRRNRRGTKRGNPLIWLAAALLCLAPLLVTGQDRAQSHAPAELPNEDVPEVAGPPAATTSLDIVVIADFKGELGDLYNRLRRAIQRWCVDACTEHGWEIPFPQLTLHGALERRD